jgi:cytochrome c
VNLIHSSLAGTLFLVSTAAAPADDFDRGYALALKKGCFECHTLGSNYVGPSFHALAERYRFDPEARVQLPDIIRAGSKGHWGERFNMWPQVRLTDDEVKLLVDWVLSQ